ncbi:MAG: Nucleoid occlusion factor SlmA [Cellvibrionales bacterium UBA7375]|nr:nucleoid occlusion factor SlmA [Gammaproteobacteria bacterium]CAI8167161.1 MAG: Nucleoid occlusion factor SlmA [Cellvibrionales bacterium UBA7375]|tara:strand:+ start:611 stop:1204 length:594 start_codon:yes stop_codon:yes gene_type:complete
MVAKHNSKAQDILQALALMLESSRGARITTAALASELGCSEAALYRHFPSKTKMYEGLIDFIEETIFARVNNIINDEPDAVNQCQRILSLTLTFAEKNAGISRLLHGDALTGETERLRHRIAQFFSRLESQLKQIVREAELNQGIIVNPSPAIAVDLMINLLEGKISQFVRSDFKQHPTQYWQDQWPLLAEQLFSRP